MTTEREMLKALQELNGHVTKMFNDVNTRMHKKCGKDIFDKMDIKEELALNAGIAQVQRMYCVLMHNYVPDELLTDTDKIKITQTIKCCDDIVDECTGALAGQGVKKYTVMKDDSEEEENDDDWNDDDDSFISEMTEEAQEKRLKCLRAVPKDELKTILKESGLTKKQIDWCINKIHSDDQSLGDDDTDIGLDVLKKLKGI